MNKMKSAASVKTLKKSQPVCNPNADAFDSSAIDSAFELELYWCVQQLETALRSGNLNQKVAEDTAKNLKTLTSQKALIIKKRQVMKSALGDYRAKMKEEEKKMALTAKQVKFTKAKDMESSSFVKKSAIRASGKDFRFNFTPLVADNMREDDTTPKNANLNKDLHLQTSGCEGFKFNFVLDEMNDNFNLNELPIKSREII